MDQALVNLSFYRFTPLGDLASLREQLRARGEELGLMGTILIAAEGVNAMVSGGQEAVKAFEREARSRFGDFTAKYGEIREHSFSRFLVKIKKEIISVGDPALKPHLRTAARISPAELKAWLDSGKDFILLDTRNDYEVEVGTFRGARHFNLLASSEFAEKARSQVAGWKDVPVVAFCTGGIRCEKASALLLQEGLENVFQLDGGILKYFEENGSAFFDGHCFVYDWRLAVDGRLLPVPRSADPNKDFGRHKKPVG